MVELSEEAMLKVEIGQKLGPFPESLAELWMQGENKYWGKLKVPLEWTHE